MLVTLSYQLAVLLSWGTGPCRPPPVRGRVSAPPRDHTSPVPRVPAVDPSQLTSGEMADQDGSDASPAESQGEFPPTQKVDWQTFNMDELLLKLLNSARRRVFSWVCRCLNAVGELERFKSLGAGSVTGVGLTINPTHPAGCSAFLKYDMLSKLCYYCQFYRRCRCW